LIFGLESCSYCKNSIAYAKEQNLQFKYYSVDKHYNYFMNIIEKLSELEPSLNISADHKTFPVIFYNGKFIGGYNDLKNQDFL
jgi:glutaredoxin